MTKRLKGFTLIEIIVVVVIISIVATIVAVGVNQSRKNARINGAKTSLKTALPIIVSCKDSGGLVHIPSGSETGVKLICNTIPGAFWPKLAGGYTYGGGTYDSNNCSFQVSTSGDVMMPSGSTYLICDCATQACK